MSYLHNCGWQFIKNCNIVILIQKGTRNDTGIDSNRCSGNKRMELKVWNKDKIGYGL